jgi:hypothetical protein
MSIRWTTPDPKDPMGRLTFHQPTDNRGVQVLTTTLAKVSSKFAKIVGVI